MVCCVVSGVGCLEGDGNNRCNNVCICIPKSKYNTFVHICDGLGGQGDGTKTADNGKRFIGRLERQGEGEKEAEHLLQTKGIELRLAIWFVKKYA
jgi:hypothetical protein